MLEQASMADAAASAGDRLRIGVLALGGLGGSGRVACDLARGLAASGYGVALLTCPDPQFADEHGPLVEHVSVRAPREPRPAGLWVADLAADIVSTVRRLQLQVLTVHYAMGLAEAAITARERLRAEGISLRVAVTLHGSDVSQLPTDSPEIERLGAAIRQADHVTAVSDTLALQAQGSFRLSEPPPVILNGVDFELFHPGDRPLASTRPRGRLCHVSNFRPIKRPLDNVEVVEHLVRRGTDVSLTMIGDGPLRGPTRQLVERRGLQDAVTFVDPVNQAELSNYLRDADLLLVTSQTESFGLVAVEALASGTPFVGTRCGGLEELLRTPEPWDLASRLLVAPGDTLRLAQRVARLLRDDDERNEVRRLGMQLGRERFDRPRQLDAYATLLRQLRAEVAS